MAAFAICTQNRKCLLGEISNREMQMNDAGRMVQTVWNEIPVFYPGIEIDEFVVMPNHVYGIAVLVGATPRGCPGNRQPRAEEGQPQGVAPTGGLSLPDVVHRFKTMTTKRYTDGVKHHGWPPFPRRLWQRNYWKHIVRNESELNSIREYIHLNPARWDSDPLFEEAVLP